MLNEERGILQSAFSNSIARPPPASSAGVSCRAPESDFQATGLVTVAEMARRLAPEGPVLAEARWAVVPAGLADRAAAVEWSGVYPRLRRSRNPGRAGTDAGRSQTDPGHGQCAGSR